MRQKCDVCGGTLDVHDNELVVRDMVLNLKTLGGCPVDHICGSCREQLEAELTYGRPEEATEVLPRPVPHVHLLHIVRK